MLVANINVHTVLKKFERRLIALKRHFIKDTRQLVNFVSRIVENSNFGCHAQLLISTEEEDKNKKLNIIIKLDEEPEVIREMIESVLELELVHIQEYDKYKLLIYKKNKKDELVVLILGNC